MVLADWTCSGVGTCTLDPVEKYAGNSALKIHAPTNTPGDTILTHDTFLEAQAQIIAWVRWHTGGDNADPKINLSGYGDVNLTPFLTESTWEKFKVLFWYDAGSNTKWGRIEKWVGSAWVQQGSDVDFGTGSPAGSTLALKMTAAFAHVADAWFDELEVSS